MGLTTDQTTDRRPRDGAAQLALIDPPAARTTLDGAWWPRSPDLAEELPPLITELHRRGVEPLCPSPRWGTGTRGVSGS